MMTYFKMMMPCKSPAGAPSWEGLGGAPGDQAKNDKHGDSD
jgi:hypothetical protein